MTTKRRLFAKIARWGEDVPAVDRWVLGALAGLTVLAAVRSAAVNGPRLLGRVEQAIAGTAQRGDARDAREATETR